MTPSPIAAAGTAVGLGAAGAAVGLGTGGGAVGGAAGADGAAPEHAATSEELRPRNTQRSTVRRVTVASFMTHRPLVLL